MTHYDFKRLRKLRLEAELTQVELSKKSGVSQQLISDLETGAALQPSYDVVRALADAFGMTSDELAG